MLQSVSAKLKNGLRSAIAGLEKTGFFHIFGSSVINKVISFISGILLVRILTKSEYGIYTFAVNKYDLFFMFSGLGVSSAILQMCSETDDEHRRQEIFRFGCRFGLGVNLLMALGILALALLLPFEFEGANLILAMMCLLPLFSLLADIEQLYLRTELRNKEFAYTNTVSTLCTCVLSCLLSLILRTAGMVISQYITAIVIILLCMLRYKVPNPLKRSGLRRRDLQGFFSISIISALNNGLSSLMYILDIFVLGIFVPDETVLASYKVATTIPTALAFIPAAVVTYIYPYFARNKNDRGWLFSNYKKLLLGLGGLNLLISLCLTLFAPLIIRLLYGPEYMDAVIPFQILSVSYFFAGTFRTVAGNLLVTQRKLGFNLFVAIFSGAMNTLLNVVMIQRWQSNGAAIATIATILLTSIMNTVYLLHTFKKLPVSPPAAAEE